MLTTIGASITLAAVYFTIRFFQSCLLVEHSWNESGPPASDEAAFDVYLRSLYTQEHRRKWFAFAVITAYMAGVICTIPQTWWIGEAWRLGVLLTVTATFLVTSFRAMVHNDRQMNHRFERYR